MVVISSASSPQGMEQPMKLGEDSTIQEMKAALKKIGKVPTVYEALNDSGTLKAIKEGSNLPQQTDFKKPSIVSENNFKQLLDQVDTPTKKRSPSLAKPKRQKVKDLARGIARKIFRHK